MTTKYELRSKFISEATTISSLTEDILENDNLHEKIKIQDKKVVKSLHANNSGEKSQCHSNSNCQSISISNKPLSPPHTPKKASEKLKLPQINSPDQSTTGIETFSFLMSPSKHVDSTPYNKNLDSHVPNDFEHCNIFTDLSEMTDTTSIMDNLDGNDHSAQSSQPAYDPIIKAIVDKYTSDKNIWMTKEEIWNIHSFVTNTIHSNLTDVLINKDIDYVLCQDEKKDHWKRCCNTEIRKINKHFPRNIRKHYIKRLYDIIYADNLSDIYEQCEAAVRKDMKLLYEKYEVDPKESTKNRIRRTYKIMRLRFGKFDVLHAMKAVRMGLKENN